MQIFFYHLYFIGWTFRVVRKTARSYSKFLFLGVLDFHATQWTDRRTNQCQVVNVCLSITKCGLLRIESSSGQTSLQWTVCHETHPGSRWSDLVSSHARHVGSLGSSCRKKHYDHPAVFWYLAGHSCEQQIHLHIIPRTH